MKSMKYLIIALLPFIFFSCGEEREVDDTVTLGDEEEVVVEAEVDSDIHRAFFDNLRNLCGQSFVGKPIYPLDDPEHPFYDQPIMVSFSVCERDRVHMPLQVGEDLSRTWMLTLTEDGLLLKHDHRHEDGTPEELTMYGGYATEEGTEWNQFFPADDETAEMLPEASTNVWNMVINEEEGTFEYILHRHGNLRFHAVIDISEPATF